MRRRAAEFASALDAPDEVVHAVALAVSETVTNAVLHAYAGREPGPVRVSCRADGGSLVVEVVEEGVGIAARTDSPGIGHGRATVGALAHTLKISPGPNGPGTTVTMSFGSPAPAPEARDLEPLCALA